jgi:hypothetical protein
VFDRIFPFHILEKGHALSALFSMGKLRSALRLEHSFLVLLCCPLPFGLV